MLDTRSTAFMNELDAIVASQPPAPLRHEFVLVRTHLLELAVENLDESLALRAFRAAVYFKAVTTGRLRSSEQRSSAETLRPVRFVADGRLRELVE